MNKELDQTIHEDCQIVEDSLKKYLGQNFDTPNMLLTAINYSLFSSGKRIRPTLAIEAAKSLGEDPSLIIPLADALELIHCYSLIHDDLPAMDDDNFRRGMPTNHRVYGEDYAILAGDGLLNLAMERALSGVPQEESKNYIDTMKMLFYFSGINGMIGGQAADITSDIVTANEEFIDYVNSHKTGALICASILCGIIPYTGINDSRIKHYLNYGSAIGEIFQITDDILDVTETTENLGKDAHSDERNSKVNYVSLYGMFSSKQKVEELKEKALEELKMINPDTDFFENFTEYLCYRKK